MERIEENANFLGFRFGQCFGDAYKKSKKIRPTELLVLLLWFS